MKNIAIIPARSGSKRILNKNIKLVAGYPLLSYPIICAKKCQEIDSVIVATDSNMYSDIAKSYGAEVIMRPSNISTDSSKTEDVISHVLNELEKEGRVFDNIILMQATSPVVNPSDVSSALSKMKKEGSASLVTYTDFKGFFVNDKDIISRPMTQDKAPKRLESGAFWIMRTSDFKSKHNRICEPVSYMKLDRLSSIDIDDSLDLELADFILSKKRRIENKTYFKSRPYLGNYESYYGANVDPDGVLRDNTSTAEMKHKNIVAQDEINYINKLSKDGSMRKILDLGCGTGSMSVSFDNSYEKYGLEIPESVTQSAKDFFGLDRLHIGHLEKRTYEAEFFDVVFCFHVIEHVTNPVEFVENISKILKTHGKLVIGCPNFDSAMSRRFGNNFRMLHDKTHCSLFGDRGLSDLLSDFGFQIDKIGYPFFDTEYHTMENFARTFDTSKVSPPFYGNIMSIYATKK